MTSHRAYIGTYTETLPHVIGKAAGIETALYADGVFEASATAARTRNPSWLVADRARSLLYAINETTDFEGAVGGGITSYSIGAGGDLTELVTRPSYGAEPCHGELLEDGRFVAIANYRTGQVAVYGADGAGGLTAVPSGLVVQHGATHANARRQEQPHAHAIVVDPVTFEVLVPDLGQDAVIRYRLVGGALAEVGRIALLPGEGPRHIVFHPDGAHLFVVNELANTVATFRRIGDGPFLRISSTSTLPLDFDGHNQTAALRLDTTGQFLYATNRGHDSISVLRFDGQGLELIQNVPAEGLEPRELVLDPEEAFVLLANQDSNEIVVRPRAVDGTLGAITGRYAFATPVCIVFA
jgi:6-phosphogluconolactonase